jgi:hypothetical protein
MLLVALAVAVHSVALIVMTAVIAIGAFVIATLVHAALAGIYAAALYRYATNTQETRGFDSHALEQAFRPA